MGFTPLEGLVMGTRAGDLDPGVLLHLLRQGDLDVDGLEDLLHHRSGLAGLAGRSDFRDLVAALDAGDETAARRTRSTATGSGSTSGHTSQCSAART